MTGFEKKHSQIVKGAAVCLLLWHHLFGTEQDIVGNGVQLRFLSVHQLANSLLGAGSTQGVNVSNGLDAAKIAGNIAAGVDLSDGLGLDDLFRVAGKFLGGR